MPAGAADATPEPEIVEALELDELAWPEDRAAASFAPAAPEPPRDEILSDEPLAFEPLEAIEALGTPDGGDFSPAETIAFAAEGWPAPDQLVAIDDEAAWLESDLGTPTFDFGGPPHGDASAGIVSPPEEAAPAQVPAPIPPETEPAAEAAAEAPAAPDITAIAAPELVRIGSSELSRPLYDLYLAEARHHLGILHTELARLTANPTLLPPEPALRAAHTLAGISGATRVMTLQRLARALEHAIERVRDHGVAPSAEHAALLNATNDTLEAMLAEVATGRMPLDVPELVEQLEGVGREIALDAGVEADEILSAAPAPAVPERAAVPAPDHGEAVAAVRDDIDAQLLPIFLEEGADLVGELHATLRVWRAGSGGNEPAKAVARLLHTLKGSARMAGAMTLGQHVHQLESRLESALQAGAESEDLIDELVAGLDHAEQLFDRLASGEALAATPHRRRDDLPPAAEAEGAGAESAGSGATLRVRAEAVDRFVNDAGEIGIARTRIAGELRTLRRSLLDLTENVIRLRNQLREVEIQGDVQMQSRIAHSGAHQDEFDPLEMDRYTRLQELTRMMAESVGDVTTVQQNLLRNLDAAELALNSQARLSRDLQQALMQVRMVPFDSLADRLYRVTRQTAKDLGKRASLDLRGGRIEIDRSVLEHMTAPLEHLLRNAVAHGIEAPDRRRAAGKDEIGQITLCVSQEGNEIAIVLADDGAGLDFAQIAERARASGLLAPDEVADERRLTNLIFIPGFSTAGNVSTVAGRGVGMDVVKSETAAVGGRIDVHAAKSRGTEFRIYLPLTLAVTQALLVRAAGRSYAIPSSMVAQVLELKSDALAALKRDGGTTWQDQRFAYRYLPPLLGDRSSQPDTQRFNWVLLLRAGAQTLALHVDALRGNQEIVVKNAGPQLARIIGISGATVLGDGEIVLILNPVALASRSLAGAAMPGGPATAAEGLEAPEPLEPFEAAADVLPTIMVVDDSLTVRKITGRLLEREGFRVVTAKDGVDALERLIDSVPDVILSDIEMPRMDGFDLLRNIRSDERTRDVPVILITSRLADKHRQYAEKIGANHYLGKPYDEAELLGLLRQYTARRALPA
jgi:chemosensory pili system protein ChpA (sensor histidine kinase/response regulator)